MYAQYGWNGRRQKEKNMSYLACVLEVWVDQPAGTKINIPINIPMNIPIPYPHDHPN